MLAQLFKTKLLTKNVFFQAFLVAFVAFFTFLPTLENFFYLDEWGNLYEWTHGYQYTHPLFTTDIFYTLFKTFGLNATGYFVAGFTVYILSVIIFYFFARRLLKNKTLGLAAGLLYATSPVGINTTTMVWTYIAEGGYLLTTMLLVLLYLLLACHRGRKALPLVLFFFAFLLFLELMPRRTFMFLPILVLFDYLVNFKKFIPSLGFVARTVTLFALFISYYKYDVSLTKIFLTGRINFVEAASGYDWQTKIEVAKAAITNSKPLITLTNILLAGPWLFISERLTGYVDLLSISGVGFIVYGTLIATAILVVLAWKVRREWGLLILFSLGWIHLNILGIYIFSSPGVSDVAHRTLSLAAPGYALFITLAGAALYTFFARKNKKSSVKLNRIFVVLLLLLLSGNFLATRHNFEKFNAFHSRPARAFFSDLKRFYPTLPANPMIYIDTLGDPQIKYKLSRIYGGSNYGAGATLAVFYPEVTKEEVEFTRDFVLVQKFVSTDPTKIDRVFAFYYDKNGLSDITSDIRTQLKGKK